MRRLIAVAMTLGLIGPAARVLHAQETTAEAIGKKIDRGVNLLTNELRQTWDQVRATVDRMGVQGRVYGRLHWDKELTEATIDIEVREDHTVVLKGSVPNRSAKSKAAQLAQDTVGVHEVIDRLAVESE